MGSVVGVLSSRAGVAAPIFMLQRLANGTWKQQTTPETQFLDSHPFLTVTTSLEEIMSLPLSVCLSVCPQDNSKSCGRNFDEFLEDATHD